MPPSTSEIRTFRQNVQNVFQQGLQVKFVPGKLMGPLPGPEPLGCCWVERVQEDPARVDEAQVIFSIRIFLPFWTQQVPEVPFDPSPLEDLADEVLAVIAANQTGLGMWFQRVRAITIDPDTQGIQADLLAYTANAGTRAA